MDSQAFTSADVSARAQDYTVASWIHRPQPAPVAYINKKTNPYHWHPWARRNVKL